MSKIFQALQKASGQKSDIARSVLTTDPVVADDASADVQNGSHSAPLETAVLDGAEIHEDEEVSASANGITVASEDEFAATAAKIRSIQFEVREDLPLLPFSGRNTHAAEQYRIIRTKVTQHPADPRMIVISSAESGDGKSINAINLAGALALNRDTRVLLIDADLHRSSLARYLEVPSNPGLADLLLGDREPHEAIVQVEPYDNLFFLPGGGTDRRGSAELLSSPAWTETADNLRHYFDYVVIDAPPAGAVADFDLIQAVCDGVVLVIRQDHTKRQLAYRTISSVPKHKLLGVIMNCVEQWSLGQKLGYYNYYYYSKYYQGRD